MKGSILIYARDPGQRSAYEQGLLKEGISCTSASSLEELGTCLSQRPSFDEASELQAALIDSAGMFQEVVSVLRTLRTWPKTRDIPILVVLNSKEELRQAVELERSVDDYITRPVSPRELAARIRAVHRRSTARVPSTEPNTLICGPLCLDMELNHASLGRRSLPLTQREFDLLVYFVRHPGKVLSRERILQDVWGLKYLGASRTIDAHIRRLRNKLGAHAFLIQTVVGAGYRFAQPE